MPVRLWTKTSLSPPSKPSWRHPPTLPELTLLNTVAKKKAKELLSHVEEYFEQEKKYDQT